MDPVPRHLSPPLFVLVAALIAMGGPTTLPDLRRADIRPDELRRKAHEELCPPKSAP